MPKARRADRSSAPRAIRRISHATPPTQPRARKERIVKADGRRFAGPVFTLYVGEEEIEYCVQQTILSQSPVLSRLCASDFLETSTRQIHLDEDDPTIFGFVLEYLYRQDYEARHAYKIARQNNTLEPDTKASDFVYCTHLSIYLMADKYLLDGLQRLVLSKILTTTAVNYRVFFETAARVYENSANTNGPYFAYFRENAQKCVESAMHQDWFHEFFGQGGKFACDLAQLLAFVASKHKRKCVEDVVAT
ncbi:MAG: hypothetical protein M1835_003217 [Candelina submexicana]|nr:MAG: hypothetical protein M1835_003217 [Candelina submexicana]